MNFWNRISNAISNWLDFQPKSYIDWEEPSTKAAKEHAFYRAAAREQEGLEEYEDSRNEPWPGIDKADTSIVLPFRVWDLESVCDGWGGLTASEREALPAPPLKAPTKSHKPKAAKKAIPVAPKPKKARTARSVKPERLLKETGQTRKALKKAVKRKKP